MADNNTPPADDVRETLAKLLLDHPSIDLPSMPNFSSSDPGDVADVRAIVNRIVTAFEVCPYGTVTDTEVDAGAQALYAADPILYALPEWREKIGSPKPWSALNEGTRDVYRKRARPVLEAAREARNA